MPLYRIEEVKETTGGGCLGLIAIIVIIGYVMNQQKQKTEDKPKTEKVQNKDSIDDVNKKRIYKTITKKTKSISFENEEDVISYLDGKEFYSDSNIILKVDGDRIMVNDNRIYTDIKIILEEDVFHDGVGFTNTPSKKINHHYLNSSFIAPSTYFIEFLNQSPNQLIHRALHHFRYKMPRFLIHSYFKQVLKYCNI